MTAEEVQEVERLLHEARLVGSARHEERMRFAGIIEHLIRETEQPDEIRAYGRVAQALLG